MTSLTSQVTVYDLPTTWTCNLNLVSTIFSLLRSYRVGHTTRRRVLFVWFVLDPNNYRLRAISVSKQIFFTNKILIIKIYLIILLEDKILI